MQNPCRGRRVTEPRTNLGFGQEAGQALREGRPLLALESTIITHGMPYPRNLETALAVQQAAREAGATPATVAIVGGQLRVGLEDVEIGLLARAGPDAIKCSRRDIPFALRRGTPGGTTVAATMFVAAMAGIRVFATGGIGGVHRGAETSLDISADLQELARTGVAVVCAGPKSILDIGLTLEHLETHGVPVIGYRCDDLPSFFSRKSGFAVDFRLESPAEIAEVLSTKWSLGLEGGVVIANPVPEAQALPLEEVERWIERASGKAAALGVAGNDLTPFLLRRIEEYSGGRSLEANVELMLNNARLGAEIAAALQGLRPAASSAGK